eukprot:301428_1
MVNVIVKELKWTPLLLLVISNVLYCQSSVDSGILYDIYISTNGEYWYPRKWKENDIFNCPCTLPFVICQDNRVYTLDISVFNNVTGYLPESVSNLTECVVFSISNNVLSGNIPNSIAQFDNIDNFDLSNNSLQGTIPMFAKKQTGWSILNISNNNISGTIPNTIINLPKLITLDLSNNNLHGTIPNDICGTVSNLGIFNVSFNYLNGSIPRIKKCIGLEYLDFSTNLFTGTIPDIAWEITPKVLMLQNNQLTGTIPANLLSYPYIDMHNNTLSGSLPNNTNNLETFVFIASNNMITGTIPETMRTIGMEYLDLSNNQLIGSIPSELFNDINPISNRRGLFLQNNSLTGSVPIFFNAFTTLYLSNNKLSGIFPKLTPQSRNLQNLLLDNNNFEGKRDNIFSNIDLMNNLEVITLHNNKFHSD